MNQSINVSEKLRIISVLANLIESVVPLQLQITRMENYIDIQLSKFMPPCNIPEIAFNLVKKLLKAYSVSLHFIYKFCGEQAKKDRL